MPNSLVPGQQGLHTRRGPPSEALADMSDDSESGRGRATHRRIFRLPLPLSLSGDGFDSIRGWRSRASSPSGRPKTPETQSPSQSNPGSPSPSSPESSPDISDGDLESSDHDEAPKPLRSTHKSHKSASPRRSKSHERHGNHHHSSKRSRNHAKHHLPLHLTYSRNEVSVSDEHRAFSDPRLRVRPRVDAFKKSIKNYVNEMPPDLLPKFSGDVLVMGGYRGSILRSVRTHKQVWIPIKVGFKIRKIKVGLGLSDDAELHASESLYADGMLEHVGPIDISRPLIKGLEERNHGSCKIHSWGYDWRLALEISGRELFEHLKQLYNSKPAESTEPKGTIVIAHSMGGLVAHHAVHLAIAEGCPEVIRGIVYVGTPFGCAQILSPLRYGDAVLFAKNVLTAQVNFSMRCSFYLLPLDGMCFANEDDTTEEYPLDFFDADTWVEHNLSPCVSTDPTFRATQTGSDPGCKEYDHDEAMAYLRRELARSKKFLEGLRPKHEPQKYPSMSVVYSSAIPTARGVLTPSRDAIKHTNFDHLLYGAGDGVVHRRHIFPLCAGYDEFDIPVFDSDYTHVGLCCDLKAVGQGLASILEREGHSREELFKPSPSASILSVVPMSSLRIGSRTRHSNSNNGGYAGPEGAHSPESRSPSSPSSISHIPVSRPLQVKTSDLHSSSFPSSTSSPIQSPALQSPVSSTCSSAVPSREGSPTPKAEVLSPAVSSSSREGEIVPASSHGHRPQKKSEGMVSTVEHKVLTSLNGGLNELGRLFGRKKPL